MNKYMTFEVSWQKRLDVNEDTMMTTYGEEQLSKCFKYGKNLFIREESVNTMVSAQAYLTLDEVKTGDLYDGQVVKSVNNYPESWDNRVMLYEVLTWDS